MPTSRRFSTSNRFCKYIIFISVFAAHLAVNFQFSGPVYVHDEMGYLLNAAFMTGSNADGASSYFAGYSLFLIPAFLAFSDPWWLWKAIVATNAILFGASFFLAFNISAALFPDISNRRRLIFNLLCALYPAYLTGSGYAFALPGQVLVFMFAVWCLIQRQTIAWALLYSAACGFLFCIHPTGAATVIASTVILTIRGWRDSKWVDAAVGTVTAFLMVVIYRQVIQPQMISAMTPAGFDPQLHYPSTSGMLSLFTSFSTIAEIFLRSAGIVAYLTIASVGFAFWGMIYAMKHSTHLMRAPAPKPIAYISLFCLISLAGTLLMGSATFTTGFGAIIDTFFYARYAEAVVLPFLLFGVLIHVRDNYLIAAGFVLLTTAMLRLNPEFMAAPQHDPWHSINFINSTGLWPLALPADLSVLQMFVIGAVAVAIVGMLKSPISHSVLAAALATGCVLALKFHAFLYPLWGTAGSLPAVIAANWPAKTCVGVDPVQGYDPSYKFNLLRYYLHNYEYKRVNNWPNDCDGPLLTYRPDAFVLPGTEIIAKEIKANGLALVARKGNEISAKYPGLYTGRDEVCLSSWCQEWRASQLFSNAGRLESDALRSDGRSDFLAYGPYISLDAGDYVVEIDADVEASDQAFIDVVAGSSTTAGTITLAKSPVSDLTTRSPLTIAFKAKEPAQRLEVRFWVSPMTKIALRGYTIKRTLPH